jgi:GAF domain-containing protein
VRESARRFEVLAEASATLAASLDWETTLRNVVDLTIPEVADFGFFDVIEPGGNVRRLARAHDDPALQEMLDQTRWQRSERTDINLCALSSGLTGVHPNIDDAWYEHAATGPAHYEVMKALGFCSMITVPLRHGDGLLGALTLFHARSGRHHTPSDVSLVEEIARRAAAAVENARLHRELQDAVLRRDEADRRKDEFLAMLGHELRNPLAPVATALELMRLKGNGALARERESSSGRSST